MAPKKQDSVPLDCVRQFILDTSRSLGDAEGKKGALARWSKEMGLNHSYLRQFIYSKNGAPLKEPIRAQLAKLMGVDERRLMTSEQASRLEKLTDGKADTVSTGRLTVIDGGARQPPSSAESERFIKANGHLLSHCAVLVYELVEAEFMDPAGDWLTTRDKFPSDLFGNYVLKIFTIALADNGTLPKRNAAREILRVVRGGKNAPSGAT